MAASSTYGHSADGYPKRVAFAVNKANLTHDMIVNTGLFSISVLSQDVPFEIFQHFGFRADGIPTSSAVGPLPGGAKMVRCT